MSEPDRSVIIAAAYNPSAKALDLDATELVQERIYRDPAKPLYLVARCPCRYESVSISLGRAGGRKGARGALAVHDEQGCGYAPGSADAREKARQIAFGKKRP